jgi:hypothetical protein
MSRLLELYQRREKLKVELAELEAALTELRCTYCGRDMDGAHDGNTFADGEAFASIACNWRFTCSICGRAVQLSETMIREKVGGKWIVTEEYVTTRVIRQGSLYIVPEE